MEILTIITLCIIIVLFVSEKFELTHKNNSHNSTKKKTSILPNIMGKPKEINLTPTLKLQNRLSPAQQFAEEGLEIEYDSNESTNTQGTHKQKNQLEDIFEFEEEEEEFMANAADQDSGFAQGVTYEELHTTVAILKQEQISDLEKAVAENVIKKIQDTDLLNLLQTQIVATSDDIRALLDKTNLHENSNRHFDIDDFL